MTKDHKKRKQPPPSSSARKGNAEEATALRINDDMTVWQLQNECRCRGVQGFSNKNKAWLLDQLVVGSVWQSVSSASSSNASSANKKERRVVDSTANKNSAKKKCARAPTKASTRKRAKAEKDDRTRHDESPYLYDQVGFYGYHVAMNARYQEEEDEEDEDDDFDFFRGRL